MISFTIFYQYTYSYKISNIYNNVKLILNEKADDAFPWLDGTVEMGN
jgi:hypothetical protein